MPLLLCHAAYAAAMMTPSHAQTGMLSEKEIFEAAGAEIARTVRRTAAAKRKAAAKSIITKAGDFLFRAGREERKQQELAEKLEAMPAYLLADIGVTHGVEGQFSFVNDFGMVVDLMPARTDAAKTARSVGPGARQTFAAT